MKGRCDMKTLAGSIITVLLFLCAVGFADEKSDPKVPQTDQAFGGDTELELRSLRADNKLLTNTLVRKNEEIKSLKKEIEDLKESLRIANVVITDLRTREAKEQPAVIAKADTMAEEIIIYDLAIGHIYGKEILAGQVKNTGTRPIKSFTATLYFLDKNGQRVYEVRATAGRSVFQPGYSYRIRFPLFNAPKEWAADRVELLAIPADDPRAMLDRHSSEVPMGPPIRLPGSKGPVGPGRAAVSQQSSPKAKPPAVFLDEHYLEVEFSNIEYTE